MVSGFVCKKCGEFNDTEYCPIPVTSCENCGESRHSWKLSGE